MSLNCGWGKQGHAPCNIGKGLRPTTCLKTVVGLSKGMLPVI